MRPDVLAQPRSRFLALAIALTVSLAGLTSCSITGTARSDEELELARNRQRWASANLHDYEYEFQRLCFCLPEATERVRIVVRRDVIASVVRLRDGQPASTSFRWPRVDELFADVQQRLDQRTERLDVQYDPTFGYPRSIVVDIALMAADDEYSLTAGNLRRLP
jgi:Family of unknown function (DUF6174)